MIIQPAALADLAAVDSLEQDGFRDRRWRRQAWTDALESSRSHVLVAKDGGQIAGVITVSVVADVADLDRVVVATSQRGRGVGRALVERGVEQVRASGVRRVLLEVEDSNEAARALYATVGFVPVGQRANYYGVGRDAIVMELRLDEENQA